MVQTEAMTRVVPNRARDQTFDVGRGIAMILIVLGHALIGVKSAGLAPPLVPVLIVLLYSFHVAVFFVLSGVLAGSLVRRNARELARGLLIGIVYPYFLWGLLLVTAHFVMSSHTNNSVDQIDPVSFLYSPPSVLWFLYVLFFGMLLLWAIRGLPRPARIAIGLICFAAGYVLDFWMLGHLRFIGLYILAFELGRSGLHTVLSRPWFAPVSGLIMIGSFWLAAGDTRPGYPALHPEYIPAMIAGAYLVLWLSKTIAEGGGAIAGRLTRVLALVGQHTMAIFVVHILLTAGTRIALGQIGIRNWIVIVILGTILGVVLPLIADRIARPLGISRYLGWN